MLERTKIEIHDGLGANKPHCTNPAVPGGTLGLVDEGAPKYVSSIYLENFAYRI